MDINTIGEIPNLIITKWYNKKEFTAHKSVCFRKTLCCTFGKLLLRATVSDSKTITVVESDKESVQNKIKILGTIQFSTKRNCIFKPST